MACLDFVILKVNGVDVSGFSHEEAIRVFLTAHEPITVEVKKRLSGQRKAEPMRSPRKVSVAVQTDTTEEEEEEDEDEEEEDTNVLAEDEEEPLEELEEDDVDIEEVTLRKSECSERIGLTVTYVAPARCSTIPPDPHPTEVYISNITPDSVAARDGRLRQGDQILQVNGCDVSDKEETESLFAENPNAVTLLVSRCAPFVGSPAATMTTVTSEIDALRLMRRQTDEEHIYETIPEDDTDPEPIYCSPHDSESDRGGARLAFELNLTV
uniref:Uncharacterized protein n=1 Tax=Phlebotomus papatasi TaxID=29031 RepID=A0A1B0DR52_PHLPP